MDNCQSINVEHKSCIISTHETKHEGLCPNKCTYLIWPHMAWDNLGEVCAAMSWMHYLSKNLEKDEKKMCASGCNIFLLKGIKYFMDNCKANFILQIYVISSDQISQAKT